MAVALGTNIANPISTALSQWPGFDTMGKLANYGKLGATDPDAAIKALFANGEEGVWFDPSDLSTMFQAHVGTVPVTADGQSVGLILDKSVQPVSITSLPEMTCSPTVSQNGNVLTFDASPSGDQARGYPSINPKYFYRMSFTVAGTGDVQVYVGAAPVIFGPGTHTLAPWFAADAAFFIFRAGLGGFDGTVTFTELLEYGGNHAVQATDAARPLYKTDGTYHWLQFDGVDDYIGCTWPSITALSTLFAGVNRTNSSNWVMFMPSASSSQPYLGVCQAGNTLAPETSSGTPSYTVNNTLVSPSQRGVLHSAIGVSSKKVVTIENIDFDDPVFPWSGFGFGLYAGFYPTFNMYSTIAVGKQCTPTEITDTETWVNGKTGAY